jgi:hypothetical protein
MKETLLRWISPALVGVMLSGPAFAGAAIATTNTTPPTTAPASNRTSAPVQTRSVTATPAPTIDASNYQAREAAAVGLDQWAGGAGVSIYLGGSALALVVLLLVLLVIF